LKCGHVAHKQSAIFENRSEHGVDAQEKREFRDYGTKAEINLPQHVNVEHHPR
jgi:hypothetical protein